MAEKNKKEKIKTWFVTGASSGVGHEMCRQLLERGYNVIAVSRRVPDFEHKNALCLSVDVTKPETIDAAIKTGIEKFGKIDVLANNAGISASVVFEEETPEHMRDVMEVNFWGYFNTMNALLPYFRKNKNGTIINNSSQSGLVSRYSGSAYNSSKFAIEGLSGSVRIEAQKFCRVMIFNLGYFGETNVSKNKLWKFSELEEYKNLSDGYGNPRYSQNIRNNLIIAVNNIINEAEKEKMRKHLMLGDDCIYRVKAEIEERLRDWRYSKYCIKSSSVKIVSFWQTVFSVRNEYSNNKKRKVITILGLKIKVKKEKKVVCQYK